MLIARYVLGPVSDRFWTTIWTLVAAVSVWACYAFTGDSHGLAVTLAASVAFGVVALMFIPAVTSFGAGILASAICMPFAGLVALHSVVERTHPTAPAWIAYFVGAVLIGGALAAWTLLNLISPVAEFRIRFAKRDAALRDMRAPGSARAPYDNSPLSHAWVRRFVGAAVSPWSGRCGVFSNPAASGVELDRRWIMPGPAPDWCRARDGS
jgi:hypothetical protein